MAKKKNCSNFIEKFDSIFLQKQQHWVSLKHEQRWKFPLVLYLEYYIISQLADTDTSKLTDDSPDQLYMSVIYSWQGQLYPNYNKR